jgi:beta-lactamase class A
VRVRSPLVPVLAGLALLAAAPAAWAGDAALRRSLAALPALDRAARDMSPADPGSVQALYGAARDLEEALAAAAPVGADCRPLLAAARAHAHGRVLEAEGVDRLSPAARARGAARAAAARRRVDAARSACRGDARPSPVVPPVLSPASGEATFGALVARAPAGADRAELRVDGRPAGDPLRVAGGRVRTTLAVAPGRHDVELRFLSPSGVAGTARGRGVVVLPASARAAVPGARADAALAASAARLARGTSAGIWIQDLATGRAGGWNAAARFPAASTVKLGLLIAALARLGPGPAPLRADLRAMATWSSNLATNRVLVRLGGSEAGGGRLAQDVLRRLGATSSTFPGGYIVGTELQPALPGAAAPDPPPPVSRRVTTARDLARVLFALHAAAAGRAGARAETGLTERSARLLLGWLLTSEQRGDNRSLVAGGLPPGTPVAQKNGWLRDARHAATIVYGPAGPRILVLLTYRAGGMPRGRAAALGARLAALG